MGRTIGRRVVDIAQKSRGRSALRYELEVIPYFCGDIPDGVERCSFAWERGTKVYVTEAEPVNPQSHAVFWKQYLRQAATMYRDSKEAALLPKEYAFKVQAVKSGDGGKEKRRTVGKLHLNMAQFCTDRMDAKPQEMMLQLKPSGKLKVSIKATWLRDARIDHDAMTEVTAGGRSEYTEDASYYDEDEGEDGEGAAGYLEEEQDLSGFDPETGQPLPGRRGGGRSGGGADEGYGEEGQGEGEEWEGGEGHRRSRRHGRSNGAGSGPSEGRAMRRGRRHRTTQALHDPDMAEEQYGEGQGDGGGGEYEGGEGAEAGEEGRRGRKGRRGKSSSHAASADGGPEGGPGGPGSVGGGGGGGTGLKHFDMAAGRQVHRAGWRDYLCCCLPRRGPAEDPQEGDSLLAAAAAAGPGAGPPLDGGDGGEGEGGGGGGRRSSRRDRGRDRERTRDRDRDRGQEY